MDSLPGLLRLARFCESVGIFAQSRRHVMSDLGRPTIRLIPPGCIAAGCVGSLGGGFASPTVVAFDGSGNIFVGDDGCAVKEMPPGCITAGCVTTIGGGFNRVSTRSLVRSWPTRAGMPP